MAEAYCTRCGLANHRKTAGKDGEKRYSTLGKSCLRSYMVEQPGLDGGGCMQVVTAPPIEMAVVVSWAMRRMEQREQRRSSGGEDDGEGKKPGSNCLPQPCSLTV